MVPIDNNVPFDTVLDQPVSSVFKRIDIGAGGLGLDSKAGEIGHGVVNGSPPSRRFFGAVVSRR